MTENLAVKMRDVFLRMIDERRVKKTKLLVENA